MYEGTAVNQSWFNTELYMERKLSVQPVTNTCSLVYDIDKNDFSVYDSSNNLEAMVKQEKIPNCLRILRSSHTIVIVSSVYLENKFRKIILKRNQCFPIPEKLYRHIWAAWDCKGVSLIQKKRET